MRVVKWPFGVFPCSIGKQVVKWPFGKSCELPIEHDDFPWVIWLCEFTVSRGNTG